MRFFGKHTNYFVLPLSYPKISDIFPSPSEPISPYLGCCSGFAVDEKFVPVPFFFGTVPSLNCPFFIPFFILAGGAGKG